MKLFNINDTIKLGHGKSNEWKFRYYERYYNVSNYQTDIINNSCLKYLEGLKWVALYYYIECST